LVKIPSDINGQKFFYVSPTDQLGYTAFPFAGASALVGLDNNYGTSYGSTAALILGLSNSLFGLALDYSINKTWRSTKNPKISERQTHPGDNIGLYFSLPLKITTLYANAKWLTYGEGHASEDKDGNEEKLDYSDIQVYAGLTGNLGPLNYDAYLNIVRAGGTYIDKDDNKAVDENTHLGSAFHLDLGYAPLQSSTARVIVGSNNHLFLKSHDGAGNMKSASLIGIVIAPNILAETSLFGNWLAFTGARHAINLIAGGDYNNGPMNPGRDKKLSRLDVAHTDGTDAFAGVRYQETNWAVEAQVSANMFDNPFGGFNGNNMFAGFGGFVYF